MKDDEWLGGLAFLIICGFLIFIIVVITPLVLGILAVIATIRYEMLVQDGREAYDRIELEEGVTIPVDDVLRALFGAGIELPEDGFKEPIDWLAGALLGVEEEA